MGLDYVPVPTTPPKTKQDIAQQRLAKRQLARNHLLDFAVAVSQAPGGFVVDVFQRDLCAILDDFIKAMEDGKRPSLVLYAPPRCGKSEIVVRNLIPYALGKHPDWETIVATWGIDLAGDHGSDIRNYIMSSAYQELFPHTKISQTSRSKDNFGVEGRQGGFKGIGVGGGLSGYGGNLIVCDDLCKDMAVARSESQTTELFTWMQSVAMSRLSPDGAAGFILMATRWSEIDPTGRFLDSPKGKKAFVWGRPALDEDGNSCSPMRMGKEYLEEIRATVDPKIWSSLYQGCPVSEEGVVFKAKYIQYKDPPPLAELRTYITADPAASSKEASNFWAYCVWGVDHEDNLYLLHLYHKRGKDVNGLTYIESILTDAQHYKPMHIYMERCHASNVLEPIVNKMMREKKQYFSFSYPSPGNKDKVSRSASIAARLQQGKVFIQQNSVAGTVVHELLAFPDGKNDDIVDCFSMMGRVLDTTVAAPPPPLPSIKEDRRFTWDKAKHGVVKQSQHCAARRPRSLFK